MTTYDELMRRLLTHPAALAAFADECDAPSEKVAGFATWLGNTAGKLDHKVEHLQSAGARAQAAYARQRRGMAGADEARKRGTWMKQRMRQQLSRKAAGTEPGGKNAKSWFDRSTTFGGTKIQNKHLVVGGAGAATLGAAGLGTGAYVAGRRDKQTV